MHFWYFGILFFFNLLALGMFAHGNISVVFQMKLMEPLLQSSSKYERSASLVAMAVITEGCADYIRKK